MTKTTPKKVTKTAPRTQLQLYKEILWDLSLKDKALADVARNIAYAELKFTKKLLLPEDAIQRARAYLILKEISDLASKNNTPSEPINT
jgi:hypothetical protein